MGCGVYFPPFRHLYILAGCLSFPFTKHPNPPSLAAGFSHCSEPCVAQCDTSEPDCCPTARPEACTATSSAALTWHHFVVSRRMMMIYSIVASGTSCLTCLSSDVCCTLLSLERQRKGYAERLSKM